MKRERGRRWGGRERDGIRGNKVQKDNDGDTK